MTRVHFEDMMGLGPVTIEVDVASILVALIRLLFLAEAVLNFGHIMMA